MQPRRLGWLCIVVAAALASGHAQAQDYPTRPIRLIVTSPAGGLVDVVGRLLADELAAHLGQPLVIDNRPGGMTQVGADALVRAPPDGYTLMLGTSEATMLPYLKRSYHYDPLKDFTPVASFATSWTVLAVHPSVPAGSLGELVSYAQAHPGRLRYGSGGVGGALHIAVEMLKLAAGLDIVHVPYRSGAQATTDAISGQIDLVSMGLASARVAEGGKLRLLAQTGPTRHPLFADVPTTAELGWPQVRMVTWFGLIAPPRLPEPTVAHLGRAAQAVAAEPRIHEKLAALGCALAIMPQPEFVEFIAQDSRKWQQLVPSMGIALID